MAGPLNYTTSVAASRSMSECIALLAGHGASAIGSTYDKGIPTGLSFTIPTVHGERTYRLPVNTGGTYKALYQAWRDGKIDRRFGTSQEHAERVAWRVLKDWLEAQLALIEAGIAGLDQVLLPYMVIDGEHTVYQAFLENESRLAIES